MDQRFMFRSNRPDGRFVEIDAAIHAQLKSIKPKLAFDPEVAGYTRSRHEERDTADLIIRIGV